MNRTQILNTLISHFDYYRYLEIGVGGGGNFRKVSCPHKVGVDPSPKSASTIKTTSDQFFEHNSDEFDLIFIDGLHHWDQVLKDIINSLNILSYGGTIVCHDMNPIDEISQEVPRQTFRWNGDCWKAWVFLRKLRSDLDMVVLNTDHGCGVIRRGRQLRLDSNLPMDWENFSHCREEWLNLVNANLLDSLLMTWRLSDTDNTLPSHENHSIC